MNTNVVTAKQTDAPFGFDRVPDCRVSVFRGSSSIVHSHPGRPPARPPCKTAWSATTPHHKLDFTWFFELTKPLHLGLYPGSHLLFVGQPEIYRRGYLPTVAIDLQGDGAASPAT